MLNDGHSSVRHPSKTLLRLISRYHFFSDRLKTPIESPGVVAHWPTAGRSVDWPNDFTQTSTPQSSQIPLPLRSKNHCDVSGTNKPTLVLPEPFQSPTTGIPDDSPNVSA